MQRKWWQRIWARVSALARLRRGGESAACARGFFAKLALCGIELGAFARCASAIIFLPASGPGQLFAA